MEGGRVNLRTGAVDCGGAASSAPSKSVHLRAPEVANGVLEVQETFFGCAGCGKIYWQGSHWDRVSNKYGGRKK